MELPKELKALLEELGEQLRLVEVGADAKPANAPEPAGETSPPKTRTRTSWKERLAAWWRSLKRKSMAFWDRATLGVQQLVQWLAAKVSAFRGRNNRDWIIAGLVMVAAIAVVIATVKSFALIVALLAAFGLLALVRVIQRLQDGLVL